VKKFRTKISRNVVVLGFASLLNDISTEIILPILPMFIQSLGGTPLAIGLIGGLRDSMASLIALFAGYWSDRIGRRRIFVMSGYSISAICKLMLAFSQQWFHVLIFSSVERTGKGVRTASRDAIIAESTPHQKGFSFLNYRNEVS